MSACKLAIMPSAAQKKVLKAAQRKGSKKLTKQKSGFNSEAPIDVDEGGSEWADSQSDEEDCSSSRRGRPRFWRRRWNWFCKLDPRDGGHIICGKEHEEWSTFHSECEVRRSTYFSLQTIFGGRVRCGGWDASLDRVEGAPTTLTLIFVMLRAPLFSRSKPLFLCM